MEWVLKWYCWAYVWASGCVSCVLIFSRCDLEVYAWLNNYTGYYNKSLLNEILFVLFFIFLVCCTYMCWAVVGADGSTVLRRKRPGHSRAGNHDSITGVAVLVLGATRCFTLCLYIFINVTNKDTRRIPLELQLPWVAGIAGIDFSRPILNFHDGELISFIQLPS